MKFSAAYVEMINAGINAPATEGNRSYPLASLEIMLLSYAQHRAHEREVAAFRQFCQQFGWQLSAGQHRRYKQQLKSGYTLILTDAAKVIRWTSHNFMQMTGYRSVDAIGQKPSMLQGPETDQAELKRIREQLARAEPVRAELLNYRKDGSVYTCAVAIDPLHNEKGELTHFLAIEKEVILT